MTRRISASRPMTGNQTPGPSLEDQVAAVLLQSLVGHFGVGGGDALVAADLVSALRNESLVMPACLSSRPAAVELSSARASRRCSTDTYSSLRRLASRSAASSRWARRWVTKTWPGAAPGPVTFGLVRESSSRTAARSSFGSVPACCSNRGIRPSS